jgi:fimbrial isopeptide formation D2 family protein/uncharacterized repeat protein (TIGR01451 family)
MIPAHRWLHCSFGALALPSLTVDGSHTNSASVTYASWPSNPRGYSAGPASASFNVAALTLGKTANGTAQATIGQVVTYTLQLSGPAGTAHSLALTDTLPAGLVFLGSAGSSGLGALPGPSVSSPDDGSQPVTVTWNFGDKVLGSAARLITYTARLADVPANHNGIQLTNNATLNYQNTSNARQSRTAFSALNVIEPALSIAKTVRPTRGVQAGATLYYAIYVTNTAGAASQVVVTDTLAAGTRYNAGSLTCADQAGRALVPAVVSSISNLVITFGTIPASGSLGCNFTALALPTLTLNGSHTNTAWVTYADVSSQPRGYRSGPATASFTVLGLTLAKSIGGAGQATVGQVVTYTLSIAGPAGTARSLALTDTLPAGMLFVGVSGSSGLGTLPTAGVTSPDDGSRPVTMTWSFGDLILSGAPGLITYTARLADMPGNRSGVQLTNDATLSWLDAGGSAHRLTSTAVVNVVEPKLQLSKAFTPSRTAPGGQVTVSFVVTNVGTSTAYGVAISDPLTPTQLVSPAGMTAGCGFAFGTQAANGRTTVTYSGGLVPPGAVCAMQFQLTLSSAVSTTSSSQVFNTALLVQALTQPASNPYGRNEPQLSSTASLEATSPTLALVTHFAAGTVESGGVYVEWAVADERGTAGYYVYRQAAGGSWQPISVDLLPASPGDGPGALYRLSDPGAQPGGRYIYRLEEVESRGVRRSYGPYKVTVSGPLALPAGTYAAARTLTLGSPAGPLTFEERSEARLRAAPTTTPTAAAAPVPQSWVQNPGSKTQVPSQTARNHMLWLPLILDGSSVPATPTGAARILVSQDGLYYLDVADIASALGVPKAAAGDLIQQNLLRLSNAGQDVAVLPAAGNAGLYFYGQSPSSQFTNENTYWLQRGSGTQMLPEPGGAPGPVAGETFADTSHAEQNVYPLTALFSDPAADYWMWDYVQAGTAVDHKSFPVQGSGAARTGLASLTARFMGATDSQTGADHHVVLSINGVRVGEGRWAGTTPYTLTVSFDAGLLQPGANTVQVAGILDAGVPYSIFYINSFDLAYQRSYSAVNDQLLLRGGGNPVVTVSGFTGPNVEVFDLADPLHPRLVSGVTLDQANGSYRVSFRPQSGDRPYLALTAPAAVRASLSAAPSGPQLKAAGRGAEYIIITSAALSGTAQALASYRAGAGLQAAVVDLQQIYDEFNYGVASPQAIRDFLSFAYATWNPRPRYVLLAGNGSFDYKNYLGYNDCIVPPLMAGTVDGGIAPADMLYGDVGAGSSVPQMAIGRLPVLTASELQAEIAKIRAYEAADGSGWSRQVLMLADQPGIGGNFASESDELAGLISPQYSVQKVYVGQFGAAQARALTLDAFRAGRGLVNYVGHGGLDRLSADGLLLTSDVPSLENGARLPVLSAATCVVGNDSVPGYATLSQSLVLEPDGGAIATFAPTSIAFDADSIQLDQAFISVSTGSEAMRLGDAVDLSLQQYAAEGGTGYVLDGYELEGDPALELKWR